MSFANEHVNSKGPSVWKKNKSFRLIESLVQTLKNMPDKENRIWVLHFFYNSFNIFSFIPPKIMFTNYIHGKSSFELDSNNIYITLLY